jgi:hypothetical protein
MPEIKKSPLSGILDCDLELEGIVVLRDVQDLDLLHLEAGLDEPNSTLKMVQRALHFYRGIRGPQLLLDSHFQLSEIGPGYVSVQSHCASFVPHSNMYD